MKTLIRFITKNAAGAVEHSDKLIDTNVLTIGRATDQTLHLQDRRARLQHAEIKHDNGEFVITTNALAGVSVNGRSQREATLSIGDVIEVGANILRVIEPVNGADLAISFELSSEARREDLATDWTGTPSGIAGLSKRRLAWSLAAIVAVFGLLLPGLGLIHPDIASFMRNSALLPDDGLWLAGPVHSAHSATSTECQNCHTALFQRVPDDACAACHKVDRHVASTPHAVLGEVRCATCHLEHNEPPQLVKQHQGLCADCHGDLPADVPLRAATDFLDAHPAFRISLLTPERGADNTTDWAVRQVALADATGADRSNLRFDHQVHLDADGVMTPDGQRTLDCGECHRAEPGGARMLPISMDAHCSGCHTLSFDADDPAREVPHGDPAAVLQALVEYYSARLLDADPEAAGQRVRRPGQALTRADRDRAAAEARVQALAVAGDLFERRACANCHEVTSTGDPAMPWAVEPVRLTASFFPHANFSHAAHDTDVTRCDSCHNASTSNVSTDVLIPDIDTCRACHGSGVARRNSSAQAPSTCIMCHSFHFDARGTYP